MTIQEAHTNFRFLFDKLSTGAMPAMTVEGIDLALNNAFENYIKTKYRGIRERLDRKNGFDSIQKRIDDLSALITTNEAVPLTDVNDRIKTFDLSTLAVPYQHHLKSSVQIGDTTRYRSIQISKQDNLNIMDDDPFNRSTSIRPKGYFEGNLFIIKKTVKGTQIGNLMRLTYLRRFTPVNLVSNVTFEIADSAHLEIIKMAVQAVLEITESRRVQTNLANVINSE